MSEKINYQEVSAEDFGRSLRGFGVNLLVKDTAQTIVFLELVFGFQAVRQSADYAIMRLPELPNAGEPPAHFLVQLHADHTYSSNPLPSLLPESGARGGGAELRLYDIDPDIAEEQAKANGYMVLQNTTDKPHGLRECFILDPDGYCWVPSRALVEVEKSEL